MKYKFLLLLILTMPMLSVASESEYVITIKHSYGLDFPTFWTVDNGEWVAIMQDEDIDFYSVVLHKKDYPKEDGASFKIEKNGGVMPRPLRIDSVLLCGEKVIVLSTRAFYTKQIINYVYDRIVFNNEGTHKIKEIADEISDEYRGLIPAGNLGQYYCEKNDDIDG